MGVLHSKSCRKQQSETGKCVCGWGAINPVIPGVTMPVRCGECSIIYKRVEAPPGVPANAESTGLCAVCGPRALREAAQ